jgi:hypothetical protein
VKTKLPMWRRVGTISTPGMSQTRVYRIWRGMLARCLNERSASYHYYGGRGITVCERWMTFENFLKDMGHPPDGRSLDRKNNNGNYEKRNCHWATRLEQAFNRRPTRAARGTAMLRKKRQRLLTLRAAIDELTSELAELEVEVAALNSAGEQLVAAEPA